MLVDTVLLILNITISNTTLVNTMLVDIVAEIINDLQNFDTNIQTFNHTPKSLT